MHCGYLVETDEQPEIFDPYEDPALWSLIEPYYAENEPEVLWWDYCEIGGRFSDEIPNNSCPGYDIPSDVEVYGIIGEWGIINFDMDVDDGADNIIPGHNLGDFDHCKPAEEMWPHDAFKVALGEMRRHVVNWIDNNAANSFMQDIRNQIDPDKWYTLIDFHC